MNIYLDDNLAEVQLINLLANGGHAVIQPADVGMIGKSDAKHFEYAIRNQWIVLTRDSDDFEDLHKLVLSSGGSHPGILIVRFEHNSKKRMKPRHITTAISKLIRAGITRTNCLLVLNQWR